VCVFVGEWTEHYQKCTARKFNLNIMDQLQLRTTASFSRQMIAMTRSIEEHREWCRGKSEKEKKSSSTSY
jgi:hypothetical protein